MKTIKHLHARQTILAGLQTGRGFLGLAAYLNKRGHKLIITGTGPSAVINGHRYSFRACGLFPDFITMMEKSEGIAPRFGDESKSAEVLAARLTWIIRSNFSEDIAELNEPLSLYLQRLQPSFINKIITEVFFGMSRESKETRALNLHQLLRPSFIFSIEAQISQESTRVLVEQRKPKRHLTPLEKLNRYSRLLEEL